MSLVPPQYIPIGSAKVEQAQNLFKQIVNDFAGENLLAQITAAGKTKLIQDAVQEVLNYGNAGSLWEAYCAVERVKITPQMAPFLTGARKAEFKNKLVEALSKL
jgi:late competence protein required for DNA uptake (superfamily II DNA/RNA helicase)